MPISFAAVEPRGRRRLRLFFDNSLASGAFSGLSFYRVTCDDGAGPSPSVLAAILVSNSPNVVELVLNHDLVDGGLYHATADGVPASDGSTTATPSTVPFRLGEVRQRPTEAETTSDALRMLLGEDLVFDGDFVESDNGDLASVSGVQTVVQQGKNNVESNGLPWNMPYGAKLRKYADGSPFMLPNALADAVASLLKDDRFVAVSGELQDGEIVLNTTLVGDIPATISTKAPGIK